MANAYLFVSHTLSTFNDRLFEVAAVLFIVVIFPGTLFPSSLYALCRALAAILAGPSVGRYVDTTDRLTCVRLSILLQRLSVALSCVLFYMMTLASMKPPLQYLLFFGVIVFAIVEKLCAMINTISIERDWVVVIADDNQAALSYLNSRMRQIDLSCKLAAPLVAGLLIDYSLHFGLLAVLAINLCSPAIEYFTIASVYSNTTELAVPKGETVQQILSFRQSYAHYFSHKAFVPSFCLSMLYLTVLSFNGTFIAFLLNSGIKIGVVTLLRSLSSVFELSATFLNPWVMKRIGVIRCGLWFINLEAIALLVVCGAFFAPIRQQLRLDVIIAGVIVSRVGLWGYDLSAQIIIQQEVEPISQGSFSSVEASLQNVFDTMQYLLTIIFSRPEDFEIPTAITAVNVVLAASIFAVFVRKRHGHLLHTSKCFHRKQAYDLLRAEVTTTGEQ